MSTQGQLVSNLLGGISQQPEDKRSPTQARDARNVYFSALDGASKRWPTQHVDQFSALADPDSVLIAYDRQDTAGADQQYFALVGKGQINVVDADGTSYPVRDTTQSAPYSVTQATRNYLGSASGSYEAGRADLKAQLVVDTAFVVNRKVITAETTGPQRASWDVNKRSAGLFVRQMNWGVKLQVRCKVAGKDEFTVNYTAPSNFIDEASNLRNSLGDLVANREADWSFTVETSSSHVGAADGWLVENTRIPNAPFPVTDNEDLLYAHTAATTKETVSTYRRGAWTYDPATRIAKLKADAFAANPTTSPLYFGWHNLETRRAVGPGGGDLTSDYQSDAISGEKVSIPRTFPVTTDYAAQKLKEAILDLMADNDSPSDPGDVTGIISVEPGRYTSGSSLLLRTVADIEVFEVTDSVGNTYITGWTDTVEEISDLPLVFRHGAICRVSNLTAETLDDYYVRFASEKWMRDTDQNYDNFYDSTYTDYFGQGQWQETALPETGKGRLDAATMPHIIKRSQDDGAGKYTGTPNSIFFDVRPYDEWVDKSAGDSESNPAPSFVGEKLTDVFFHQGRLGFVSNNNVILSETGELGSFWRTTVLSLPDSEPIDIAATEDQGAPLLSAVPIDERLMLFSTESQVVVASRTGVLSPATVQAPVASRHDGLRNADPVLIGRTVFMPYSNTNYIGVRELLPLGEVDAIGDVDVTQAIPRLIPRGGFTRVRGSDVDDLMLLFTDAEPKKLYAYKYVKSGEEYRMAAWCIWETKGTIVDFTFVDRYLYLVVNYDVSVGGPTKTCLERMEIGPGQADVNSNIVMHLDRRVYYANGVGLTATYDRTTDKTTFTLPTASYTVSTDTAIEAVTANNGAGQEEGIRLEVTQRIPGTNSVVVRGDHTGKSLFFGEPYTFSWTANKPFVKYNTGQGLAVSKSAETLTRSATVGVSRTAALDAEVQYKAGETYTTTYNGGGLGTLGVAFTDDFDNTDPIRTDEVKVSINSMSDNFKLTLKNDTPYPSNITTLEWALRHRRKYPPSAIF